MEPYDLSNLSEDDKALLKAAATASLDYAVVCTDEVIATCGNFDAAVRAANRCCFNVITYDYGREAWVLAAFFIV